MDITTPHHVTETTNVAEITRAKSATARVARYLWALARLCLG